MIAAGAAAGESYWPMPLESHLRKSLESPSLILRTLVPGFTVAAADCGSVPEGVRGRGHTPGLTWILVGPAFNEEAPYGFTSKEGRYWASGTATLVNFIQSHAK